MCSKKLGKLYKLEESQNTFMYYEKTWTNLPFNLVKPSFSQTYMTMVFGRTPIKSHGTGALRDNEECLAATQH